MVKIVFYQKYGQNVENEVVRRGSGGGAGQGWTLSTLLGKAVWCTGLCIKPPYITLFLGAIVLQVPTFEAIFWSTTPSDAGDCMC
jgi:hypothetical protein